jgi:hypothetical protein
MFPSSVLSRERMARVTNSRPPDRQSGGTDAQVLFASTPAAMGDSNETKDQTNQSDHFSTIPREIVDALVCWESLPRPIRAAMVALVRAARSK